MLYPPRLTPKVILGVAVTMALSSIASATVIVTNTTDVAPAGGSPGQAYTPTAFTASSSDLLEGLTPTVTYTNGTGSTMTESAAGVSAWTDGSLTTIYALSPNTGSNEVANHAAYGTVTASPGGVQTSIVYDLGGLYNLSSANVYAGWNDSGRDLFSFTLDVSPDGVTYTTIGTFTKGPDNTGTYTTPVTNQINFVDDGGAAIASSVEFVRISANDADNGYAGMAEFDVFGTSAVPEPASLGLLMGAGGLLMLKRRRRVS